MVGSHQQWLLLVIVVLPLLLAALVVAACGARSPTTSSSGERARSAELSEVELSDYANVLEAVQSLRPQWLRERTPLVLSPRSGTMRANPVWIYWDGTRLGDPSYLGRIAPSEVSRVIHYDARTASARWGIGHENGVIYLVPAVGSVRPL